MKCFIMWFFPASYYFLTLSKVQIYSSATITTTTTTTTMTTATSKQANKQTNKQQKGQTKEPSYEFELIKVSLFFDKLIPVNFI